MTTLGLMSGACEMLPAPSMRESVVASWPSRSLDQEIVAEYMSESRDGSAIVHLGDEHYACDVTVVNEMGLHARPASMLVGLANQFACEINIGRAGNTVDGKSILQLLSLSAESGSILSFEARGEGALAAIQALTELVRNGFHETSEGAQPSSAPEKGA